MAYCYFLFSLIIATIYWGVTVTEEKENKTIPVEIKFVDVKDGFSVIGPDAHTKVQVEVSATQEILKKITSDDIKVEVSAKNFTEGALVYELTKDDIILPSSVALVDIFPKILQLQLDKNIIKNIPLKPQFVGKLKGGKSIIYYDITPPYVQIYGPTTILKNLKYVPTQPILLNEKEEDFNIPVIPIVDDKELKVLSDEKGFMLKVVISGKKSKKIVENVKVTPINLPENLEVVLNPQELNVVVESNDKEIDSVNKDDILAIIDLTNLTLSDKIINIKPYVERRKDCNKSFQIVSFFPNYIEISVRKN